MQLSILIRADGQGKRLKSMAAMAATLLLANMQAVAQAEATPAQTVSPDAKQTSETIAFDRRCASPEIPLDGAPLPALSLDPTNEARLEPPRLPSHQRSGTTRMHLLVNEQGWVVRARVAASQGDRIMDAAILRSVEQWRFKPRYLDAKPVCAWGSYALTVEAPADEADAPEPSAPPRDRQ